MTDGTDPDHDPDSDASVDADTRIGVDVGTDSDDDYRDLDRATAAVDRGEAVAYPTETVYGLGANALDADAVEGVFSLKGRSRNEPISLAVSCIEEVDEYARPTDRERRFLDAFLPGPVTVLVETRSSVPDVLTAGRERVGIRVPDHDVARALCRRCGPVTATSANRSGEPNARTVSELDSRIRDGVAAVLDGGRTPGTESTVVDVGKSEIVRRGAGVKEIEAWLAEF